jgi:hypothetical protein
VGHNFLIYKEGLWRVSMIFKPCESPDILGSSPE